MPAVPDCPPAGVLRAFLFEPTTDPAGPGLSAHLDRCHACRVRLAELDPALRLLDPSRATHGSPPAVPLELTLRLKALVPADPDPAWVPVVPGFAGLVPVGRGGSGRVYRARREADGATVAIKVVENPGAEAAGAGRFGAEAAAAGLDHPNIVRTLGHGEYDGRCHLILEFCPGGSLADKLDGTPWAPAAAARIVARVALAVQYAHGRGVIHRDLKPANILFASPGSDPEPKVADFGLARWADRPGPTSSYAVLGTPAYLAPEQAGGGSKHVGPAADVYALGAVLYELLAGRPPFPGTHPAEILLQVLHDEPTPLSQVRPGVPRDLATVCRRCLEKNPARRYGTAADLAADLDRFLAGTPVRARPVGAAEAAARWVRRHPTRTVLATAVMVGVAGLVVGFVRHGEAVRQVQAEELVGALDTANPGQVPELIERLRPHAGRAEPLLRNRAGAGPGAGAHWLHARLALLALTGDDPGTVFEYLSRAHPDEVPVICRFLRPHAAELAPRCWAWVGPDAEPEKVLRGAAFLAAVAPDDEQWRGAAPRVVAAVVRENPLFVGRWANELRPVRGDLFESLLSIHHTASGSEREVAAAVLGELAAGRADVLAAAVAGADPRGHRLLFPALSQTGPAGVAELERELANPDPARRANVAATLLRLGATRAAWRAWRTEPAPDTRAHLVDRVPVYSPDPAPLVARLRDEPDAGARRALVLALGRYPPDRSHPGVPDDLLARYRYDPDPGTHAALGWTLRQWGHAAAVRAADATLADLPPGGRGWLVQRIGDGFETFVVLSPGEFRMGVRDGEPLVMPYEQPVHTRVVPRRVAVATTEVTAAEFDRFRRATGWRPDSGKGRPLTPDGPVFRVSWFDAAAYCRWRSEQVPWADMSRTCFPPQDGIKPGLVLPPDALDLPGYRLPTEGEWEYACRAGTETPWFVGGRADLLRGYAWFDANSEDYPRPVGRLMPNDWGLFDTLGNVWEWTLGGPDVYPVGRSVDALGQDRVVRENSQRVLRGGAHPNRAALVRAGHRGLVAATYGETDETIGFRVVFTLPGPAAGEGR